jgi:acyl carrier protein
MRLTAGEADQTIEVGELGQSTMSVDQVADTSEQMKQLTTYISEKVMKAKGAAINEDTPLVSSGLIDSFAMIEIFLELQRIAARKVPASKVQAKDMDTVRSMFAMAEKFGKPAKS